MARLGYSEKPIQKLRHLGRLIFLPFQMIYLKRFSAVTIKVKIGTLLGTEWVLSIANWRQPSQRIAEQFFRIGGEVVQLEKAVATLVFF